MNRHCRLQHRAMGWNGVLVTCLLFAAGCGMGGRSPADNRTFLLQIDPPAEGAGPPSVSIPLRIRSCRVAAPFAGRPLVYRLTAVQYQYDAYNAFLVPLGDQLDDALYRWLEAGSTAPPDQASYMLDPYLESLVADFTDPNRPSASARIRFLLTRSGPDNSRPSVVFQKTLVAKVRMSAKPSADQVVAAFSACIQHVLTQLRTTLAAMPGQEAKKGDPRGLPLANE